MAVDDTNKLAPHKEQSYFLLLLISLYDFVLARILLLCYCQQYRGVCQPQRFFFSIFLFFVRLFCFYIRTRCEYEWFGRVEEWGEWVWEGDERCYFILVMSFLLFVVAYLLLLDFIADLKHHKIIITTTMSTTQTSSLKHFRRCQLMVVSVDECESTENDANRTNHILLICTHSTHNTNENM